MYVLYKCVYTMYINIYIYINMCMYIMCIYLIYENSSFICHRKKESQWATNSYSTSIYKSDYICEVI